MNTTHDHLQAKEYRRRRADVADIKRRAQQWRLMDCSAETLERMRRALLDEMARIQANLERTEQMFVRYVENGRPLKTEQTRQSIDRLTLEWEALNKHLQEVDEAILERQLRQRLIRLLGSKARVNFLEAVVFALILLIVTLTLVELIAPLPATTIRWITVIDTFISLFLLGDFFLRLALSSDKSWYFRRYWIDFVSSIPFVQALRFGRLVRIARFARLLRLLRLNRALRVMRFAFRGLDKLGRTFQVNLLKRSVLIALALLFFGALSISALEGPYEASLLRLGESLWWSFTTVVTGGFADLYNPATPTGRGVTVGLVLLGLTVTGIFTASLTSVMVEDESTRIEQAQHNLEAELALLQGKLDLLSGETNAGLIAMETVAQALANQQTPAGIADALLTTMLRDFACVQASLHVLDKGQTQLARIAHAGDPRLAPPAQLAPGDDLVGRVMARLLAKPDAAALDIEPVTEPCFDTDGMRMVCPLVAGGRVLGALHVVLPDNLARFYLYNRAPQTLAHQAAMALRVVGLDGTAVM